MLTHQGKDFSTQLNRVTMPSIDQCSFSFAPHALEQAVDRCAMHRDRTVHPRFSDRDSLLHL
ncbi:MAG TPA: hypothetical protein VH164_01285, partial [Ktedonobacteraceae bacterium]|nr:hypothetical protein [Ktedonobacteraceae bacterium]